MKISPLIYSVTTVLLLLFSCSQEADKKENSNESAGEAQQETEDIDLEAKDLAPVDFDTNLIGKDYFKGKEELVEKLHQLAPDSKSFPFFFIQGEDHYIISSNQTEKEEFYELNSSMNFGLIKGDSIVLLKTEYEKIYNPNFTARNCVEFKKGKLNGLLNFKTGLKTEAQFDYIVPQRNQDDNKVYANRSGKWYSIDVNSMKAEELSFFNPRKSIGKTKLMDVNNPATWIIRTKVEGEGNNEPEFGTNIILVPSFLDKTKVMGDNYYPGFIPKGLDAYFGTDELSMSIEEFRVLNDNVLSFISNTHISELDARGYESDGQYLTVVNIMTNQMSTIGLGTNGDYNYWCDGLAYKYLNDTLIEINISGENYDKKSYGYDFESIYDYYVITQDGEAKQAESNRKFSFTKFADIDESYFKGCFGKFVDPDEEGRTLLQTGHLTIEDLDVMRNEIFAEYGYKFKSEKWQKYFGKFKWYEPKHDNVDDQLTERDKANLEIILSVQKKMKGKEKEFTKPELKGYVAAG